MELSKEERMLFSIALADEARSELKNLYWSATKTGLEKLERAYRLLTRALELERQS
jgi:hypothetical protein